MIRITIDFECEADEWWENGGRVLWESLVEGFDNNAVLLDDALAASVMEQAAGLHPVKVTGEVGMAVPLYSCAPGKAILAYLPAEELGGWLRETKLKKFTPNTHATKGAIREELKKTASRGYAVDVEEGLVGIHCVAAPVFDQYRYPVASVTVMAPIFRLSEEKFEEVGQRCIEAADQIYERLVN